MADAKLNVDVDVDGAWKLKKLIHDLKKVARQAQQIKLADVGKAMQARTKALGKELTDQTRVHRRHFDNVDKMAAMSGKMIHKFIGMAAKFAAIQVAALGAALLVVHAAFIAGQAAMKAWNWLMKAGAGAVGALATAASIAAAAMREQQAAMYAYKGTNMGEFGKGINQVRVQMRMMQTDSQLATIGAEGLNAALAEIYKTGTYGGGTQKMLKSLMDFGSAGQDVAKGAAAAGKLIATMQDPKADFSKIKDAAKELGPAMEQALEKLNITTKEGLAQAISDGSLAAAGGVTGQFDTVSGTLFSKFKAFKTQAIALFADFGQPLLAPAKKAMDDILFSFKRTFVRISGSLASFSQGSFFDGLTSAITKMEDFFVKFVNNHLPKAQGMLGGMGEKMRMFKAAWDTVLEKLRPLIDGARVLEKMFGNIFRIVGQELLSGFGHVNDLLVENRDDVEAFGSKIGKLITVLMKYGKTLRDIFFEALPFINKIIDGVTVLLDAVFSLTGAMRSLFGGGSFSSFLMLAGAIAGGKSLKKTIGGTISKAIPVQDIKANVVNVNGGVVNGTPMHGVTAGGQTTARAVANANALGQTGNAGLNPGATSGSRSQRGGLGAPGSGMNGPNSPFAQYAGNTGAAATAASSGLGGAASGSRARAHPAARRHTQADLDRRARGINAAKAYRTAMPTRKLMQDLKSGAVAPKTHAEWAMQDKKFRIAADGSIALDAKGRPILDWEEGGRRKNLKRAGYSTANLSDAPGDTWSKDSKMGRFGTGVRNARSKYFREPRTSAGYQKLFGDGKNFKGKLNGMGASMGATMGLGLAASVAPKEMQGALALGSSLAAINPMLGVGVGLVGAGMQANNPLAGAAMGAAGGAALGAKFGPWGAAIGGLGGALVGGIGSWWNKNKRKKQEAAKVGKDIVKQATDSMFDGMRKTLQNIGTIGLTSANIKKTIANASKPITDLQTNAKEALAYIERNGKDAFKGELQRQFDTKSGPFAQFLPDQAAVDQATGDITGFLNTILTQSENNQKIQTYITDKYTLKIKQLSKAMGKSEEDIISLAQETNTNLFDVKQNFADTMASMVEGLAVTKEEINARFADAMGDAMDRFRVVGEIDRAPAVLDEIGRSLYEMGQAGPISVGDASDKIQEMFAGFTQFYGGNQVQAAMSMIEQLGEGGLAYQQENGYFSDPNVMAAFTTGPIAEAFKAYSADILAADGSGLAGQVPMDQLTSALAKLDSGGLEGTGAIFEDLPRVFTELAKIDPTKYFKLQEFLDPTKDSSLRAGKGLNELSGDEIYRVLGSQLGDLLPEMPGWQKLSTTVPDVEGDLTNLGIKANEVAAAFDAVKNILYEVSGVTPPTPAKDTTTPRGDTASSRFNATFMKHQALSSMVTGKRQITSGVRNFNLGSINSDHVTGGALDLVGQNLGQYKSAVEANGGFAEFHGVNAARHLHVVPNARATGDSSTAVSMGAVKQDGAAVSSGSTNNYSININGYNKNPQQLAAEVLALIKANERSITERK